MTTTDQLIQQLRSATEEFAKTLTETLASIAADLETAGVRLDLLVDQVATADEASTVGHIDDTPVRPLTHCRYASDLVGNELIERRPGEWARLVEVVEVGHPSGERVGCTFEDGSTHWIAPNSSVKVRHDPFHPAVMREGIAAAREALRSSAPQGAA